MMANRVFSSRYLIIGALMALLVPSARAQAPAVAAIVNGETITVDEVDAILKSRPLGRFVRLSEADKRAMRLDALEMLIDDLILQQYLKKNVPAIPTAEVNKKLKELQTAVGIQGQTLAEYLHDTDQTEAQLRASIVAFLQRTSYLNSHLTDAAVHKYYEENKGFFDQESVRASHILLRLPAGAKPIDRELAEARLRTIRLDIVSGKISFEDAAKKYSNCISAPSGGDVGYFLRKGNVDERFAQTAFALKNGEISDVVVTEEGVHLIKTTEHKSGPPSEFKKVEKQARDLAGEELLRNLVTQQRGNAKVEIKLPK